MSSIFFKLEIRKKKRDFLSEKRESGMTLKKREFTPESGSVDTYVNVKINVVNTSMCLELIDIVRIVTRLIMLRSWSASFTIKKKKICYGG